MAIDNKDKKVLKSSIEREQNELACSAEREKIKGPKNLNVPPLRFPEFSGEWEKCKFGDIATGFDYGMNAAAKPFDGENKYIRITDIDEASSTYNNTDIVSPDGTLTDNYVVNDRDILLARTGASTGKSYLYRKSDGKLYYAGFLIRANVTEHNPYFVFSQLHIHRYWRWVSIMSARSGQPGINSQEYSFFPVFTTSLQEENKISTLLSLLDERIATQNKIIKLYESLMSGIVEKTFVSTRYAPLQHYAPIITSGKDKDSGGNYPLYGSTGIIGSVSKPSYTKTAVLIARVGSIGNVQYVTIPCGISDNTLIIDAGENNRFIYYYLNDYNFSHITSGTTQPLITASSVKKIAVPIIEKQRKKKIIAMMNSIEHKLCNEKHIASLLSRQKGFLLSQMFI